MNTPEQGLYAINDQEARDILAGLGKSVVFKQSLQPYANRLKTRLQKHEELVEHAGIEHVPPAHLKDMEIPLAITALKYHMHSLLPPFKGALPPERVEALLQIEGALERLQGIAETAGKAAALIQFDPADAPPVEQ